MKTNDATRARAEALPRDAQLEEHPMNKVRRLSRELSAALDDAGDYTLVMIYPASRHQYPISFCMDQDYSRQSYAMLRLRDAYRAYDDCSGKGVRKLRAARDLAHEELVASFYEVAS